MLAAVGTAARAAGNGRGGGDRGETGGQRATAKAPFGGHLVVMPEGVLDRAFGADGESDGCPLSGRELEVLRLAARGMPNRRPVDYSKQVLEFDPLERPHHAASGAHGRVQGGPGEGDLDPASDAGTYAGGGFRAEDHVRPQARDLPPQLRRIAQRRPNARAAPREGAGEHLPVHRGLYGHQDDRRSTPRR